MTEYKYLVMRRLVHAKLRGCLIPRRRMPGRYYCGECIEGRFLSYTRSDIQFLKTFIRPPRERARLKWPDCPVCAVRKGYRVTLNDPRVWTRTMRHIKEQHVKSECPT